MELILCAGAVVAGLVLGLRDLIPLLVGQKSGVIARKGFHAVCVHRDIDPDRFASLMANRRKGAGFGFGVAMLGAVGLGLIALAIFGVEGPLAVAVFLVYLGFALFAGYCLVQGFRTGRMFALWSLTLFGEATRKGNPVWFWTYAVINLLVVIGGLLSVLCGLVG